MNDFIYPGIKARLVLRHYDDSHCREARNFSLSNTGGAFAKLEWRFKVETLSQIDQSIEIAVEASPSQEIENVSLSVELEIEPWSTLDYLVFPGIIYAGNRFDSHPMPYPPIPKAPETLGVDKGPFINDILRLNSGPGRSAFHLLSGAMAFPTVGLWHAEKKAGLLTATAPFANGRETGWEFEENEERTRAHLRISTPGVREGWRYAAFSTASKSTDRGATLSLSSTLALRIRVWHFPCPDIPALFERLLENRSALTPRPDHVMGLPFSAAWKILEQKYNLENWSAVDTYYAVGRMNNRFENFQTGWVGGLMNTLPLSHEGSPETRQRARQTLEFFFNQGGVSPSGFFHGCYHNGVWSGDGFDLDQWTPKARPDPARNHYHLLRKSADALYFLFKHYDLFGRQEAGWKIPPRWAAGTRGCADAFVRIWRKYGQLGQFIDSNTGDILMGGTCSAGIAPAGLALASRFFGEPDYLRVAEEIAEYFVNNYTLRGLTNGGPGEILQCPDSESAAGLLESYIVLWEETADVRWLQSAEVAAAQLASWQMSYDYTFPKETVFGKLEMKSTGSVFANSQNCHSAPGICTLSGNAYFKLWRATGKSLYLQLTHELAHNLTQYLSREDRPIRAQDGRILLPGWMNERVNTSDWDDNLGGVHYGPTWAEVSLMLTIMETPGVYVRHDDKFVHVFDHVEASLSRDGKTLFLDNPTEFQADVTIFSEVNGKEALRSNYLWQAPRVSIPPKTSATFEFNREGIGGKFRLREANRFDRSPRAQRQNYNE